MTVRNIKPRVLVVEDESDLVTLLRYNLEKEGFEVTATGDGEEALLLVDERAPDIILLDWMVPMVSGIEVCRRLRRNPATRDVPIIMLTARGEEGDRVRGLNAGADDYIIKPFSPGEVIARIHAVLRRAHPTLEADVVSFADIEMDIAAHRVTRAGRPVDLRPIEFRLLRYFIGHPGRVFSREQLLDQVWPDDAFIEPRTVDVHIRRLRKALDVTGGADLIRTVRAAGYALEAPAER